MCKANYSLIKKNKDLSIHILEQEEELLLFIGQKKNIKINTKNRTKKTKNRTTNIQTLFVSLQWERIAGNAGERPANVSHELIARKGWHP